MEETVFNNKDLDVMQKQIFALKNYISALYKRLSLIKNGYATKSNYEKNEIDIVIHDTKFLIGKKSIALKCLESNFKKRAEEYFNKIEEVSKNYETLLHTVMNFYQDNIEIKHFLYPINWNKINSDINLKIELYFNLKELIEKQNK
jgi:hypothetical protein